MDILPKPITNLKPKNIAAAAVTSFKLHASFCVFIFMSLSHWFLDTRARALIGLWPSNFFLSAGIVASAKQMIVRCFSCAHQQTFDVNILGTCRNRIFVINSESDTIFVGKISDIALSSCGSGRLGTFARARKVNCRCLSMNFVSLLLLRRIIITNPQSKFHYVIVSFVSAAACLLPLLPYYYGCGYREKYTFAWCATGQIACNFIYIYGYFCYSLALISGPKEKKWSPHKHSHKNNIIPHHLRCCGRPNRAICVLVTRLT